LKTEHVKLFTERAVAHHFVDANKMVGTVLGSQREADDDMLNAREQAYESIAHKAVRNTLLNLGVCANVLGH
jgi:hypothetical protein